MANVTKGDFVIFVYDTKEEYPGKVVEVKSNGKVRVEICTNRARNGVNETEIVEGTMNQVKLRRFI